MSPKKSSDDGDDVAHSPLQAILLADSFAQKFRPITLERPKVLLPLANVPMIDYTLAWLESAGVEEVFVFCCAHSKQVVDYLEDSQWTARPNFAVSTIESRNSISAGDALRFIYDRNVIHGDFVLVSGDTVSNMPLAEVVEKHKETRKNDSRAVMTMVIQRSKNSPLTHQTRLGTDELVMAIDPETNELLYYEDKLDKSKSFICLDKAMLTDIPFLHLHNDKQDCYIDICSPEVLSLFTDNFDYQHLRRHFVKGLLVDDLMGYKIFTHEIHSSYAARVDNFRSYDTISKDIIQRWTYPFVPGVQFSGSCSLVKLERQQIYRSLDVIQSPSAQIGPSTFIGPGTVIGDDCTILNSVIGQDCIIGANVVIEGSYIWNGVNIQDNCKVNNAVICDDVVVMSGASVGSGAILSFKAVVGMQVHIPAYSKVSILPQPTNQDSDEELEYADTTIGPIDNSGVEVEDYTIDSHDSENTSTTEISGRGYIWSVCDGGQEDEWKQSIAPIPSEKLAEFLTKAQLDRDLSNQDASTVPGALEQDSNADTEDHGNDDSFKDDDNSFEKEVEATFLRAVHEVPDLLLENVKLELQSIKLSYDADSREIVSALFYSIMKLALNTPHTTSGDLLTIVKNAIVKWKDLLQHFHQDKDDEVEIILRFEDMCNESAEEYAPLFDKILPELYDQELVTEEAILSWASEKERADELDKVYLRQCEQFIQWLEEASEESTDAEDDNAEDDDE